MNRLLLLSSLMLICLFVGIAKLNTAVKQYEASVDVKAIKKAIESYVMDYKHFPLSVDEQLQAGSHDATVGLIIGNSNLVAILTDNPDTEVNGSHVKNPLKKKYLVVNTARSNAQRGIGPDGNFRDPWGHQYVITLDINLNGQCVDPVLGSIPDPIVVWSKGPAQPVCSWH